MHVVDSVCQWDYSWGHMFSVGNIEFLCPKLCLFPSRELCEDIRDFNCLYDRCSTGCSKLNYAVVAVLEVK